MTNNYKVSKNSTLLLQNQRYFIGNWKMFGDFNSYRIIKKIEKFCIKFKKKQKNSKIILCVPNILISFLKKKIKSNVISLGAQNCSQYKNQGPFTGAVSSSMLKKAGAEFVILGHSENRIEGESSQLIKQKVHSVLNQNLNVILCVGETKEEKKRGKTFSVISSQIEKSIEKNFNFKKIIIAYEPVWSIGTGKIPKINDLVIIIEFIKTIFLKKFKTNLINTPKVLYGGSVDDKNIKVFGTWAPIVDGFLIGSASQSSKKFIDIIKNYYK